MAMKSLNDRLASMQAKAKELDGDQDKTGGDSVSDEANKKPQEEKPVPVQSELLPPDTQIIARNEINLETWSAFMFPHARTRGLDRRRKIEVELLDEDGKKVKKSVQITPLAGELSFTNKTYTTLLALIVIWHKKPTPDGTFEVHLSDIAKIKGIDHNAGKNLAGIYEDLDRLNGTRVDFVSTFIDEHGIPNDQRNLHILTDFHSVSKGNRKSDKFFYGVFHPMITRNLVAGKTNPKNLTSILKIKSERGQILFRYIDTNIYNKPVFEKRALALFNNILGEEASRYEKKSNRQELLIKLASELDKSVLSNGNLLRIRVEDTADSKDVKIVCNNIQADYLPAPTRSKVKIVNKDKDLVSFLAQNIQDAVGVTDDPNWITWTEFLCQRYSENLIYRVIGEFKETSQIGDIKIEHRGRFFTNLFHRLAHEMGYEWVGRDCGKSCDKRPENNPQTSLL